MGVIGRLIDFAVPLSLLAAGVYVADRMGVIDVAAIMSSFASEYLSVDAGTLFDALAVVV